MLDLISIFNSSQATFLVAVGFMSLLIGSFLNVVIYRLPKILQKDWRRQCYEFLETKVPANEEHELDTTLLQELFTDRSHCLHCKKTIHFYDNIPLLSYLILGGKCRACKKSISIQYPIVEGLSALLCVLVAYNFGVTWQTVAGCFLTYVLIVQSTIDFRHTIIPDEITLPMIWIGLLLSINGIFVDPQASIIGAVSGYLFLWIIYWCFYLLTKKEGMGYGDFKLLAMLGAWLGWEMIPFIILCSSILGSVIGVSLFISKKKKLDRRIPFGPFLAAAGWIALIYGSAINEWYLHFAGFA